MQMSAAFQPRGRLCLFGTMRCPVYVLVGFWDGDYVSQLPYMWYYGVVKGSLKHAHEECESKRAYVFA